MLDLAKFLPAEHEDGLDEFLQVHSAVRRVRCVAITSSKGMHEYGSASPPSFFHLQVIGTLRRLSAIAALVQSFRTLGDACTR